jgi:hypothetical protein
MSKEDEETQGRIAQARMRRERNTRRKISARFSTFLLELFYNGR